MKTNLIFAIFAVLFFAQSAHASVTTGKVVRTYVLLNCPAAGQPPCSTGIVTLNTPNTSPPACSLIHTEWAFALDTAAGKAMFNAILHAQAVGATATVVGDGTCGAWPDRERPSYMYFTYPQ